MVEFNHTIVSCSNKRRSAEFLTDILGLEPASTFFDFLVVELKNGVSLDYSEKDGPIAPQHYAFLVSDSEFDSAFRRIEEQSVAHWADPGRTRSGQINRQFGGRGVYFDEPDGHLMELITKPYGAESEV